MTRGRHTCRQKPELNNKKPPGLGLRRSFLVGNCSRCYDIGLTSGMGMGFRWNRGNARPWALSTGRTTAAAACAKAARRLTALEVVAEMDMTVSVI